MLRFIVRRLLQMVVVFFGTTFLVYGLTFLTASDPIQALIGDRPVSPALRTQLTARYHLDDPFLVRYLRYMGGLLHGDFGTQLNGRSVGANLAHAWPFTVQLALLSLVVVVVFGLGAGVLAGARRGGVFDHATLALTMLVVGVPLFVLGFTLQYLLGVKWHIVHATVQPGAGLDQYVLPAIILGAVALATSFRLTRASIAENLRADYVKTANAKGLPRLRVVGVHVLRNSLIPVVTFLGIAVGDLMAGTVVIEKIFNIPGVGYQLAQGIHLQDGPTVVGIVSLFVLVYLLTNLIVDVLYAVLDPRIRYA